MYAGSLSRSVLARWTDDQIPHFLDRMTLCRFTPWSFSGEKILAAIGQIRESGYALIDREVTLQNRSAP
jgi:DNA-binding IclR family transcriptional regulator